MLSFAADSSARVQQISPASARTEVQRFPLAEDFFDGVADPVITSNPAVAHVRGRNRFRAASHSSRIGGFAARRNFSDRSCENNRSCPRTLRRSAPSAPIMGCRCQVLMVNSALTGGSYGHISFFGSRQRGDPSTDRISDEASGNLCRVLVAASFAGGS